MRRTFSSTYLASPTSSSEWCFACKKLNIIAFAGTLVYLGYLLGCLNDDRVVPAPLLTRGGRKYGSNELQASSAIADAPSSGEQSHQEVTNREVAPTPLVIEERPPTRVYANGPVIYNDKGPATSINLIGERHSGTNWITDHLVACFGDQIPVESSFTRFKHWFQTDDPSVRNESAVVIAMFRDPYDWIEAMRERPHHAHGHIGMEWKDFVSNPWVGPRGPGDQIRMKKATEQGFHIDKWGCLAGYKFDEVIPCSAEDSITKDGYSNYMYELRNDGSHRAYGSIVELRSEKIRNFMQVPTLHGVKAFFPERYEALNLRGTEHFLKKIEEVSGLKAKCEPLVGTGVVTHKSVKPAFTEWMNKYHDWEAEDLIGYVKRDPTPYERPTKLTPEQEELEASTRQSNAQDT